MKSQHLEILQHALGATEYGILPKRGSERNYYATDADDSDCLELAELGYMSKHPPISWTPYTFFTVTDAGKKAMQEASPKPPKLTRSQIRYQEFLDYSDACECTFREWLDIRKMEWYKGMKARG